jgi:ATP-dependent protease ClpP protease subunit
MSDVKLKERFKNMKIASDVCELATTNDQKLLNYVSSTGDVFILGEFDSTISQHVVPALRQLIDEKAKERDAFITIYINSNGGYTHELYNLLSLIELAHARGVGIVTVVTGRAYSCGSMLAIHGDHRVMYKYASHIIHLGRQGALDISTEKQIKRETTQMENHFNNIRKLYKEHTKLPAKELEEALTDDSYFLTAEECVKYGLCDEILGYTEEEMDALIDSFKKEKTSSKTKKTTKKPVEKKKEKSVKTKEKKEKQILLENEEKNDEG